MNEDKNPDFENYREHIYTDSKHVEDMTALNGDDYRRMTKISKVLSVVMHPFLVPVYGVFILLFANTVMSYIPWRMKIFFIGVIVLNTFIVPALFIGLLRSLGYIRDLSLSTRRDRMLPLFITAVCYLVCCYMVSGIMAGILLKKFLFAGAVCILMAMVVTYFWKISLHLISAGALFAMVLAMNIGGIGFLVVPMVILIIMAGLLASARLWLGAHNIWQVGAGFIAGFSVAAATILLPVF